ncbi:carcinine hydrolase/isopenicillin-N N-acyltransferase family protein [Bacteroidota bacterium]
MKKTLKTVFIALALLYFYPLFSCTMFMSTKNGRTLVGNNEDWKNPNTKMWFVPPENGNHGIVYFGFDNLFPQGGMNDQGLVFDGMATSPLKVKNSLHKKNYSGRLIEKIMKECSSVDEVLKVLDKYNLESFARFQLMFVDKNGESAIIEGDEIQRKKGNFQVCTNFYLSQLEKNDPIPCERYKIASNMLKQNEPSIESFRKILSAVHQEGDWGGTQYSNIYDVNKGLIYLYHYHNYENVVEINLIEELKKGYHVVDIPVLFPDTYAAGNYKRLYNR